MTVQPIRIKDYRGASNDFPLDMSKVQEEGYQISYTSPTGELWRLSAPTAEEELEQRAILIEGGWSGGVATPEFSEHEAVSMFGVRRAGFKLPAFGGSMEVVLRDTPDKLSRTWWAWRQSWSTFNEGILRVVARDGANRWTRVVLEAFTDPERSPKGLAMMRETISWKSLLGHWYGQPHRYTGSNQVVATTGDMRPECRLVWDTVANPTASVTFPSGQVLNLTAGAATGLRYISLDRGMAGQVTREDGSVDGLMWSSFQGRVLGVELQSHTKTIWQLSGMELEVTPRYLSPWG